MDIVEFVYPVFVADQDNLTYVIKNIDQIFNCNYDDLIKKIPDYVDQKGIFQLIPGLFGPIVPEVEIVSAKLKGVSFSYELDNLDKLAQDIIEYELFERRKILNTVNPDYQDIVAEVFCSANAVHGDMIYSDSYYKQS